MSDNARLFDQFWQYPSPVTEGAAGAGSDKGAEARSAESSAAGTDLFPGVWGLSTAQAGASSGGGSGSLLVTPRPLGYHVKVEPLKPGAPFPQAEVIGHNQIITGIYFWRKYTLLDQNNKPVPNASGTESALVLSNPKEIVIAPETVDWKTDQNGSFADDPYIEMDPFPESFEVIIDQKMWYRDRCIVHDTQRFIRRKGDDVNEVANHSSLTYHEAVPVTIVQ